jgi:hypothetical protein
MCFSRAYNRADNHPWRSVDKGLDNGPHQKKRMVAKKEVSFVRFLTCLRSMCVLESLLILNKYIVSIIGHCNQWGLRLVPFCSSDEGDHMDEIQTLKTKIE